MDSKKFYDMVLEDVMAFDKVLFDLEQMSNNAPNPRIRTVADVAILHVKLAREISQALKDAHDGK
ncbi:hypothetical protein pEaSNUABM50_00311 [Erwinia phage pEa_SNUABM_50]|uniref:Uncharacterized protein n=4 Tax=Eneladusvirus BF TaxID=2560751 RepID=A0A7L8ZMT3_9CAUD|nr:hypothetical protein FDH34_gp315 [Serratia phage BF]QOI71252.1 hypothetical protein pEaSNUABM12_00314 [Erwinia phage pEa_SNUABM_12]QOI71796.1 hypothetical protein pEaSNUABM47_00312 [Erwinia phage pEa_SNUABM_47]QOI72335.1 hypothetical protein pEaSNUABM50_00311 [Erwinia phage pEa_SNUABM_50]QXO11461.1 hypothetical protein pEaSNUABM19_00315 [Erwinia phage pEa_SNUABM_19]QXO12009.1 hypothetical protein pEaSNUABM44_00313 [Erwinia phage pEa_SNUABM_44]QXO12562.1 hypothetical protein pEaSNUABM49_003